MRLGFDRRLGELERHPIALADGQSGLNSTPSEQSNYWQKDGQLLPLVGRRPELLKLIGPQLLLRRCRL
jgi:hypothetical protein